MVSVITITSLCLALAAAALLVWWRRMGFNGRPDNISVSRQWLMQHQADDRS